MIPGFDLRTARLAVARRYAALALEATKRARAGFVHRYLGHALETPRRKGSHAPTTRPSPDRQRDPHEAGRLRAKRELAELFTLAQERDQVEWAAARLQDGWELEHIALALHSMPQPVSRPRGGLAARIAARDALAAAQADASTPRTTVAELTAAYHKALGIPS